MGQKFVFALFLISRTPYGLMEFICRIYIIIQFVLISNSLTILKDLSKLTQIATPLYKTEKP